MNNVIKRCGLEVEFDPFKIERAIESANDSIEVKSKRISKRLIKLITDEIVEIYSQNKRVRTVEYVQDLIEQKLIEYNAFEVARTYIKYRYKRELARGFGNDFFDAITEKLTAKNVQNQNANVDEKSFGGRMGEANSVMTKKYALDNLVSTTTRENHENNRIYQHDLDSYAVGMHNCLSVPFDDLLANGFDTRQTDVRPAGSVNTACQLIAVIFQLQSLQQFGGVSATHIDWTMVPYVRKSFYKHYKDGCKYIARCEPNDDCDEDTPIDSDKYTKQSMRVYNYAMDMTQKEIHQAVEALYHNLNTLQSRSGNQLPFTSINYGTCVLQEGRMFTKALLEVLLEGLGTVHRTSVFPCGIFQYMKGVNDRPLTINYDLYRLALKCTSKRLYPNYANVDWSGNAGYDRTDPKTYFSTMGCRTANGADINAEPGTNPQTKDGRGNICPCTIIMPTLAMEAKESYITEYDDDIIEVFMEFLDKAIDDAKDSLIERFEYICAQSPASAKFMYENGTMLGYKPEEGIRSALKHGTLAIGQLGLAETLEILIGKNHTTEEGMVLAKRIEQLFKDKCSKFKQEYKLNFGVYYTPAENLCKTAMIKFKEKYGIIPRVSDKDYFTNSIHVPVYEKVDAFQKIDIESQLTGYSSAGCITYVELDGACVHNIDALEKIVNYAMAKDIPYFAINVPNDTCLDCGFTGEFNDKCPQCGSTNIQQLRRVTGYLTGNYKTAFNSGKVAETEDRVKHTGVEVG